MSYRWGSLGMLNLINSYRGSSFGGEEWRMGYVHMTWLGRILRDQVSQWPRLRLPHKVPLVLCG